MDNAAFQHFKAVSDCVYDFTGGSGEIPFQKKKGSVFRHIICPERRYLSGGIYTGGGVFGGNAGQQEA